MLLTTNYVLGNLSGLGDMAANKRLFPALIQLILVKICVLIYMKLSATKLKTLDCYFSGLSRGQALRAPCLAHNKSQERGVLGQTLGCVAPQNLTSTSNAMPCFHSVAYIIDGPRSVFEALLL